jgi:lantibiotic modifying enzyme
MLAGFAHGASGVALALTRLWRATGDDALLRAADAALVFENRRFDAETGNWPVELRDRDGAVRGRRDMVAWCHGAPGIALARAEIGDALVSATADGRLEAAVATTLAAPVAGPDHLCCGTLGRVDIVHTIGRLLERDELLRAAEARASMVIRMAAGRGSFRLDGGPETTRPGFFRGLAGIGYVLLRIAEPRPLPSVLAFEPPATAGARP